MPAKLCLNMIVCNESAIIERCVRAAAPYVDCFVIVDTGCTDETVAIVDQTMAEAGVPGVIVHRAFHGFEQARNEALDAARSADLDFDYLLLCDADMELHVQDAGFRARLSAPAYWVHQRATTIGYQNLRLLRRDVCAHYRGATHEFLDIGAERPGTLHGAWFWDHAEGSSRAIEYERDIDLLTAALRAGPILPPDQRRRIQAKLAAALDHLEDSAHPTVPGPRTPGSITPGR